MNRALRKLGRLTGYLFFAFILAYFITGFGNVKGIIDRRVAKEIHEDILPLPVFICFVLHGLINIKFYFLRRGAKDGLFLNLCLGMAGITLFALFFYMFFR